MALNPTVPTTRVAPRRSDRSTAEGRPLTSLVNDRPRDANSTWAVTDRLRSHSLGDQRDITART
ncbi:hypothetical protein KACC15558_15600 [Brevibacterium ammoniilyticum]